MSLVEGENARWCNRCNKLMNFDKFYKHKPSKYGYRATCKECFNRERRNKTKHKYLLNLEIGWVDGELIIEDHNGRVCTKCNKLKPFDEFWSNKNLKNNVSCKCSKCKTKEFRKWKENNPKIYEQRYKEKYQKYKERYLAYSRQWYQENKERKYEKQKQWRKENKERQRELSRQWYEKNKERLNREERERRKNDPQYKLIKNYRRRIQHILNDNNKSKTTREIIDCSVKEFKQHLEDQWEEGMTWENNTSDGWHVDHIIPVSFFDQSCPYQRAVSWHYSNTRPMWYDENISKGDEIPNLFKNVNKKDIKELCKIRLMIN